MSFGLDRRSRFPRWLALLFVALVAALGAAAVEANVNSEPAQAATQVVPCHTNVCDVGAQIDKAWEQKRHTPDPCHFHTEGSRIIIHNNCKADFGYTTKQPTQPTNQPPTNQQPPTNEQPTNNQTTDSIPQGSSNEPGANPFYCDKNTCDVGAQIDQIWEHKRHTQDACHYDTNGTQIIIHNNCKADFGYTTKQPTPPTNQPPAGSAGATDSFGLSAGTGTSDEFPKPNPMFCSADDDCDTGVFIDEIEVADQLSAASCAGKFWRESTFIRVTGDCEANFRYTKIGSSATPGSGSSGSGSSGSGSTSPGDTTGTVVTCNEPVSAPLMAGHRRGTHCGNLNEATSNRISFSGQRWRKDSERTVNNTFDGNHGAVGAFRVKCFFSHFDYVDPVVHPGNDAASHLHAFFGATTVTGTDNPATLRANNTSSTCLGGTINESAYWVPALMDKTTGAPIVPEHAFIYYKTGYLLGNGAHNADAVAQNPGLKYENMARDKAIHDVLPDVGTVATTQHHANQMPWTCKGAPSGTIAGKNQVAVGEFTASRVFGESSPKPKKTIRETQCRAGDLLVMNVRFFQCWDSSQNHKSRVDLTQISGGTCPDKVIPKIEYQVYYRLPVHSNNLRLSSDNPSPEVGQFSGESVHGDWMNGWDPLFSDGDDGWIHQCINSSRDCANEVRKNSDGSWTLLGQLNQTDPAASDARRPSKGGLTH